MRKQKEEDLYKSSGSAKICHELRLHTKCPKSLAIVI